MTGLDRNQLSKKLMPIGVLIVIIVILLSASFVTVGAGDRGVLMTFGKVSQEVLVPGLHMKIPFVQTVQMLDVRIQNDQRPQTAASHDLQDVRTTVAVNWSIQPADVTWVYQNIGTEKQIVFKVLNPVISNVIKAVTAKYDASDLVVERDKVRQQIEDGIRAGVAPYKLIVQNANVTDFQFSPEYSKAIEAKQVAQQNAQKAEYDLQRVKVEAQQQIAQAKGQADAQKLLTQTLTPEIIRFDAVQKWDGHLPQVVGSNAAMPLIGNLTAGTGGSRQAIVP